MSNTFFSNTPNEAAKFTEVVVFPTPPFWFAIAIILPIDLVFLKVKRKTLFGYIS